jgi:acetyl esterase/lipase
VLLTTILTVPGAIGAPDDTWLPIGATVTLPAGRVTTLTYCSPGGIPPAMDVTEPAATAARPAAAVLYVHGGGWFEGDRQPSSMGARFAGQDGALFVPLRDELSRRGFVVASIDYVLIPLYPWPNQIEDAKCAVRFMRAEAHRLGIDPNRIGTWGSSAGGQLVAMWARRGPRRASTWRVPGPVEPGPGGGGHVRSHGPERDGGRQLVRPARHADRVRPGEHCGEGRASLANHVAHGEPPFLILHGTDDVLVPPHHSRDLAQRLKSAGVPATLVMVEHTGHSMDTPGQQPSSAEVTTTVADFFSRTLAGR